MHILCPAWSSTAENLQIFPSVQTDEVHTDTETKQIIYSDKPNCFNHFLVADNSFKWFMLFVLL